MKVLVAITQTHFIGAQQFVFQLSKHLRNQVDLVVVVGSDGDGELARRLEGIDVRCVEVSSLRRPIAPANDLRAVRDLRRLMLDEEPDVVLLNSSKAGVLGSLAAARLRPNGRRIPVVYRIGGWAFRDPGPRWQRSMWKLIERAVAGVRDLVIVNNKEDLELAERHGLGGRRGVRLIPNGIAVDNCDRLSRSAARTALAHRLDRPVGEDELWIGCVAGFYPAKGIETLAEATRLLRARSTNGPAWRVVLVGDGPEEPAVREAIASRELGAHLLLTGYLPDARRYLRAFDVFASPSYKEGFSWALLEAMAEGVPVVATGVGAAPELIEDGESGMLVPPQDADGLADALSRVLVDDGLRRRLGATGQNVVRVRYGLDSMLERYDCALGLHPERHASLSRGD